VSLGISSTGGFLDIGGTGSIIEFRCKSMGKADVSGCE
jgi:hypothetical protein